MEFVTPFLPVIYVLIGLFVVYFAAKHWIVKVPNGKMAILENVFKGKSIETGRILARDNEMGVMRRYLKQGWHVLPYPLRKVKKYVDIPNVKELAVVIAKDGAALPPDRKFADDPAGDIKDATKDFHQKFQDPGEFYDKGGIRGTQLRLLTPGPVFIHPDLFDIKEIARTRIEQGYVGVVYANDGRPLEPGQVLAKKVEGHDRFQDAAAFIAGDGQIGPQIEVLPPGVYNINTEMFKVVAMLALSVKQGHIGILISKIGKPLPRGEVCAVTPEGGDNIFTDAQEFILKGGYQGPQNRTLGAGTYYINPHAFDSEEQPLKEIQPGFVAARISFIGKEPVHDDNEPQAKDALSSKATDPAETHVNTGVRAVSIVNDGERGLQKKVLNPGMYPFNHYAEKLIDWPITVRTIEWANPAEDKKDEKTNYFNQFVIDSYDGQKMMVDVRLNYRVMAEDVPYVIRNLGSLDSLEAGVIHPTVENIFRNQVTKAPAINYVQNRANEVEEAHNTAKDALREYRVEVTGLLITDLIPPKELTDLLKDKSLAEQETQKWVAKEKAEQARITYVNRQAEADQQTALRQAETDIKVAKNRADAVRETAAGEAAQIEAVGRATATATEVKGKAEAAVKLAIATSDAEGYKLKVAAMGQDNFARLETTRALVDIKVPLVPEIMTGGNGGDNSGVANLVGTLLLPGLVKQFRDGKGSEATVSTADATPATKVEPASESDANHAQKS